MRINSSASYTANARIINKNNIAIEETKIEKKIEENAIAIPQPANTDDTLSFLDIPYGDMLGTYINTDGINITRPNSINAIISSLNGKTLDNYEELNNAIGKNKIIEIIQLSEGDVTTYKVGTDIHGWATVYVKGIYNQDAIDEFCNKFPNFGNYAVMAFFTKENTNPPTYSINNEVLDQVFPDKNITNITKLTKNWDGKSIDLPPEKINNIIDIIAEKQEKVLESKGFSSQSAKQMLSFLANNLKNNLQSWVENADDGAKFGLFPETKALLDNIEELTAPMNLSRINVYNPERNLLDSYEDNFGQLIVGCGCNSYNGEEFKNNLQFDYFKSLVNGVAEDLGLTYGEIGALSYRVLCNMGQKIPTFYGNVKMSDLNKLSPNGNGLDVFTDIIMEEASKINKNPNREVSTVDFDALNCPVSPIPADYLLGNLQNLLLSDNDGVRKFADKIAEYSMSYPSDRLIETIIYNMNKLAGVNTNNKYELTRETLTILNNNSIFDQMDNIFNKICNFGLNVDFIDVDSMLSWADSTYFGESNPNRNGFTYEEFFKLATDEAWNENHENFFSAIWRNIDEIDSNGDGYISKDELTFIESDWRNTIHNLDAQREAAYNTLSPQAKLDKVKEEARRYLELRGYNDQLKILNGHGGHWKVKIGSVNEGAAATTYSMNHEIHISANTLQNNSFEKVVGILMHELTHAALGNTIDTIAEENYCDQYKEDYLDSVGLGEWKQAEEAEQIDRENSNSEHYKDLAHDLEGINIILNGIGAGFCSVWNWIKGWF